MTFKKILLAAICLLSTVTFTVQASSEASSILLQDISVIDGLGHVPFPNRDVLLQNGKIQRISVTSAMGELPEGTQIIKGKGLTVLPGLIDAHTHIAKINYKTGSFKKRELADQQVYLDATLYAGVTTIFETGGDLVNSILLRDEIDAGTRQGPSIFTVGPTIRSMKNTQNGVGDLTKPAAVAEIKQMIDERQAVGIDIIKLYAGITPWEARHIMKEAHSRGIRGIADFWCSNMSKTIFEVARLDAYAHGTCYNKLTNEEARWMAERDKFAMITFTAFDTMGGHRAYEDYKTKGFLKNPLVVDVLGREVISEYYDNFHKLRSAIGNTDGSLYMSQQFEDTSHLVEMNYHNVRVLLEEGVLVGMGTDAAYPPGGWPGEAMHFELEHHIKAGISPVQAIKMATHNNAKFLRIDDKVGTVKSGMVADLLIVKGNPAENISDTRNIAYVIKGGKVIDRKALKAK